MANPIQLKDIFFGKTDAKNEFVTDSNEERDRFLESFLIPENILLSDFFVGAKYFITGLKGTGKTALLRYIGLELERKNSIRTSFILFKSDFSAEDKAAFAKAANAFIVDRTDSGDIEDDFVNVWKWFLHRHIVTLISKNQLNCFEDNRAFEKYKRCVLAPRLSNEEAGIVKLMPKLKRGSVEVDADVAFLKGKLGLDFEWDNESSRLVKFSSVVKQANELFSQLTPKSQKVFIFLDELELALNTQKQYQKDIKIIRDVVVAVYELNSLCRRLNFPVFIVTAIRSEVITSIRSSGKEINKPILDFGVALKWQQSGDDTSRHPLIKIINKKIQSAERKLGGRVSTEEEIWLNYFPLWIRNQNAKDYILHRTWYRPRDIVRLLGLGQEQFPNDMAFTQFIFESIRKEYSSQSWVEHVEELRSTYTEDEIEGIRKLLTSLKCPFKLGDIIQYSERKRTIYSDVDALLSKHRIGDILTHLYKVGIIGNTGDRVRYAFRGDDELVIDSEMKVHDPLWNYLSIERADPI